jgi:competence protein ComEA
MPEETSPIGEFIEKYKTPITMLLVSLIFFGLGVFLKKTNGIGSDTVKKETSMKIESPSKTPESTGSQLIVEVAGAVVSPGVYTLDPGSRVADALNKANGVSPNANTIYMQKSINLAAKVTDGQKIYIPTKEETQAVSQVIGVEISEEGKININTASQSKLEELPKIGPKTAQKIIEQRPYSTLEELITKKVVSQSVLDAIKEEIIAN